MKKKNLKHSVIVRGMKFLIKRLFIVLFLSALICCIIFFSYKYINKKFGDRIKTPTSTSLLIAQWNEHNYKAVYETSQRILEENRFNDIALIYHGYSAFYLAVAAINTVECRTLLDEAITDMRVAYQTARGLVASQIAYLLGKAYFYKDSISSYYYYADLAVKYLLIARDTGYQATDISEYLGLSYASLGDTQESIASFTEALSYNESDTLLLAIAEQYYKNVQPKAAEQYLYKVISDSKNDELVLQSHNLLGQIYIDEQKYVEAENEFNLIIEKNPKSADAYYGLGVIYEKQGDLVKARSEWRKALYIQVDHVGALNKMENYK